MRLRLLNVTDDNPDDVAMLSQPRLGCAQITIRVVSFAKERETLSARPLGIPVEDDTVAGDVLKGAAGLMRRRGVAASIVHLFIVNGV
jgi:hypothetical protein